jgi:hypothetical protein
VFRPARRERRRRGCGQHWFRRREPFLNQEIHRALDRDPRHAGVAIHPAVSRQDRVFSRPHPEARRERVRLQPRLGRRAPQARRNHGGDGLDPVLPLLALIEEAEEPPDGEVDGDRGGREADSELNDPADRDVARLVIV